MKTRCPNCQTTFRVTPEQLKARAGKVRCGQCQTVFNALDSLVEEIAAAPQTVELPEEIPAPPAATPPFTPHKEEPASARPEASTELPAETPTESPEEKPTEASPAAVPTDPSIRILLEPTLGTPERIEPEAPLDEEQAPPLSEAETQELGKATGLILPREMTEVPGYSKWSVGVMAASPFQEPEKAVRWPYVLVAIVLGALFVGQLAFRFRSELAIAAPWTRPALESFSTAFGAGIPLPRRVELVSIEASDLQNDAGHGNLLVLNATVRNRAAFPQAYPSLELSLTDTQDNPIARRIFSPDEYLPAKSRESQAFAANADIAVRIWIEAKELSAAGYRLYLFYP